MGQTFEPKSNKYDRFALERGKTGYPGAPSALGDWDGRLSNRAERIELTDATGNVVDRVRYADEGDWANRRRGEPDYGHRGWTWDTRHDGGGSSAELMNADLPNDNGQNWAPSAVDGGTPGQPNNTATPNIAPMIWNVEHFPPLPRSGDSVAVVARILDESPSGISPVLYFREDGTDSFLAVSMQDDGNHNDGTAGDGVYGAAVAPHPDGTIIEFYIRVEDASGLARAWPPPTSPEGRLLGHWGMDELSGTEAANRVNGGISGVLTNDAAFSSSGHMGAGSLSLPTSNAYVVLEQDISPPPLGLSTFTVATWFRRDVAGTLVETGSGGITAEPMVTKGRSEEDGNETDMNFFLGLVPSGGQGTVVLAADFEEHTTSGDPGDNHPIEGDTPIGLGEWHHAAATYDGSNWALYLDGALEASQAVDGTPNFDSVQPAALGTTLDSARTPEGSFIGGLDEVLIASGALTAAQIAQLASANTYQAAPGVHEANLLLQVDDAQDPPHEVIHRLLMTEAEREELEDLGDSSSESYSHAQMNGTFMHWDGRQYTVRHLIGIRNRGNGSRTATPNNRRVNFRSDEPWKGVVAVNFNSRFIWLQTVGSTLFQRAGLPAPSAFPVQLLENRESFMRQDDRMYGAYARVDVVDSDFADEHFPLDGAGNAYQGRRRSSAQHADLSYLGENPDRYRPLYQKRTNTSEDDWADLIDLCRVLSPNISEADYPAELHRVVDVEQWMRFLALHVLIDNRETNISNGEGDDYLLYRGMDDPRFVLIPHDLDTILGEGDTGGSTSRGIFEFTERAPLYRMVHHPSIAPIYYEQILDLAHGVLAADSVGPLVRTVLKGHAPDGAITGLLQFLADRIAHVDAIVPQQLTATAPDLENQGGVPYTLGLSVDLIGQSHAAYTRAITVDGIPAQWHPFEAAWSAIDIPLHPGMNHVEVQAIDEKGDVFATETLDVWSDSAYGVPTSGTLAGLHTWTANGGPYRLTGDTTVPGGSTLSIEPGTTVYADDGVTLTVGGTLVAEGTPHAPIRLTTLPGSGDEWEGLRFVDSEGTNLLAHVLMENANDGGESILVRRAILHLDHVVWSGTSETVLELDDASVDARFCTFPSIDNSETIHGSGMPDDGYVIIANSTFGTTTGYSDVIDFTGGQRPGPILQILDNVFLGGSDDGLDLDGTDAHIEGNVFAHFHKDNTSDSSSNAIATGKNGSENSSITVVRNLFIDNDHAILLKEGCHLTSQYNTYVGSTVAAINFDEPNRNVEPGLGADLESDIFWQNAVVFENRYIDDPVEGTTQLTATRCMLPGPLLHLGQGNDVRDPRFVALPDDLRLMASSPARGTGGHGLDRGAHVPSGAALVGIPDSPTRSHQATILVGGPGITHYRWRLNDEPYSGEHPVSEPIVLQDLNPGDYRVQAIGKNSAGVWQRIDQETISPTWQVDPDFSQLVISEVVADQSSILSVGGNYPDLIEIYNDGPVPVSLEGMGISDRPMEPYRYRIPAGTSIGAGAYLVFAAADFPAKFPATGFGLSQNGDGVYLTESEANGGKLVDYVVFGIQLPNRSIARDGEGHWSLATPSIGRPNEPQPVGDPHALRINEWLANQGNLFAEDFIEIYNSDPLPVDLGGLHLTDNPGGWPDRHKVTPLSFIDARAHTVFFADGEETEGANHLSFRLDGDGGWIGLFDANLEEIDIVYYGAQAPDVSEGFTPSGGHVRERLPIASPGGLNPGGGQAEVRRENVIPITHTWHYEQSGTDLGTPWRAPGFDHSTWPSGPALLYVEDDSLPAPKSTPLTLGESTYYFRTEFLFSGDPNTAGLQVQTVVDDGMVVYLNGDEVLRRGMDSGTVTHDTYADRTVGEAAYEGPTELPGVSLLTGTNTLAVEVHQANADSSDVVFGMTLDIVTTNYVQGIRLSEVLADNRSFPHDEGRLPDWIELVSSSNNDVDLVDMSLTDDLSQPRKWVFPAGSLIQAGGFLMVRCDSSTPPSSTNTGFGFDWEGDGVYLLEAPARGGALIDGVTFGLQVPDSSLSRSASGSSAWFLSEFTPNATNVAASLGDPGFARINEWMADPITGEDWFELYNPGEDAIPLDRFYLTDDLQRRAQSGIPPLSFLGSGPYGYKRFVADDEPTLGAHHVTFKLSRNGESIGLYDADGRQIDAVRFGTQQEGVSQGLWPNGGARTFAFPGSATPEAPNRLLDLDGDSVGDAWEATFGDSQLDPDGDGFTNREEFHAGTDPDDPDSHLRLTLWSSNGVSLELGYLAVVGKQYQLQASEGVGNTSWQNILILPRQPTDRAVRVPYSFDSSQNVHFFRLSVSE